MRISDWSSDVCSSDLTIEANSDSAAASARPESVMSDSFFQSDTSTTAFPGWSASALRLPVSGSSQSPVFLSYHSATPPPLARSEEHTSELQPLMRISYAVFCLKKTTQPKRMNMP